VGISKIIVNVHLKPEILDPQGRALLNALNRLGLEGVVDVRQGKQFVMSFDDEINDSKLSEIKNIAESLLSNPVIEHFSTELR
jgi:phosphoribosylformylglycinamidine synthase